MTKSEKYKATDVSQKPGESDKEYYIRLAKQADQRLVRIQKLSKEKGYEAVTSYAYATAMNDLKNFGQKRFNAKIPDPTTKKGKVLFKEKLATVKEFLQSPSSTKGGIKDIYELKADTINSRYGTNFNWQDMADFFSSGYAEKLFKELKASKTVIKAIGVIQKNMKEVKSGADTNLNLKGVPEPVKEMAIKILRRKRTSEALGMSKEERADMRNMIRQASSDEWLTVSDEDLDELPFT